MSKTERDLTSSDTDDALGEMFASEEFESSLDEALDGAELDLPSGDVDGDDASGSVDDDSGGLAEDSHHASPDDDSGSVVSDVDDDVPVSNDLPTVDPDSDWFTGSDSGAMPETVAATPDGEIADEIAAREVVVPDSDDDLDADRDQDLDGDLDEDLDDAEVSDRILEELRRADIDGPVVPLAPQDDTTTARRRPRRAADYDPAPVPIPAKVPRVLGRKPRVRKVTRVVRHVDPWSVFKIALVSNMVLYITVLTASVLLWNVAYSTNTVDNVERFFESFGWNSFEFNGGELYHAGWIAGLFIVIGLTGMAVLLATLFNLITDLVGGVRFTVLEEEVVETRTSPMRRFVVRRSEPEVPAVLRDGSGSMTREAVVDDAGANERPTR